jgi:hypothetical protein
MRLTDASMEGLTEVSTEHVTDVPMDVSTEHATDVPTDVLTDVRAERIAKSRGSTPGRQRTRKDRDRDRERE